MATSEADLQHIKNAKDATVQRLDEPRSLTFKDYKNIYGNKGGVRMIARSGLDKTNGKFYKTANTIGKSYRELKSKSIKNYFELLKQRNSPIRLTDTQQAAYNTLINKLEDAAKIKKNKAKYLFKGIGKITGGVILDLLWTAILIGTFPISFAVIAFMAMTCNPWFTNSEGVYASIHKNIIGGGIEEFEEFKELQKIPDVKEASENFVQALLGDPKEFQTEATALDSCINTSQKAAYNYLKSQFDTKMQRLNNSPAVNGEQEPNDEQTRYLLDYYKICFMIEICRMGKDKAAQSYGNTCWSNLQALQDVSHSVASIERLVG